MARRLVKILAETVEFRIVHPSRKEGKISICAATQIISDPRFFFGEIAATVALSVCRWKFACEHIRVLVRMRPDYADCGEKLW